MKNCTDCKFAEWRRTESGRLHPSGDGRCGYIYKPAPIPASMYFHGRREQPSGGYINRREELRTDCPCYEKPEWPK